METDITFLTFIQDHSKYFKKYDNLNEVEKLSLTGWLYIFSAYCYDGDITKVLPEFTDKFGKTLKELFERLYQYKEEVNIKNIEAIQCTLPCERERLVKAYLKYKKQIKPVVGNEYFVNCRNLIKILMLIIVYISDEEIIKYEISYSKHDKNDMLYTELFERIDNYIDKIKETGEFKLISKERINNIIQDEKNQQNIFQEEIIKLKKEKEQLEEYIQDYKNKLFDKDEIITKLLKNIINNNYVNGEEYYITNYNNQYKKRINSLIPFNENYLKIQVNEILPSFLLYTKYNNSELNEKFIYKNAIYYLNNILKNNILITNISQGNLVYKDEKNNIINDTIKSFVYKCINICKYDIIKLCHLCFIYLLDSIYYTSSSLTYTEKGLYFLIDYLKSDNLSMLLNDLSFKLIQSSNNIITEEEFIILLNNKDEDEDFNHLINTE